MNSDQQVPRIAPLEPPYSSDVAAALAKWMPPGAAVEPLKLFRTLIQNREMSDRMRPLGAGILGSHSSIDARDREIVIDRVCARCGCEYEWGVHVASFGQAVGLSQEKLAATVTKNPFDPTWSERESLLVQMVDELHDTSTIADALWNQLAALWTPTQLIELCIIVGWYHLISFVANAARVQPEEWAASFPPLSE
ncbi:MAG TPA: carboxymuconolactone decarboxylase family protein [Ktedonobacteraceae bacterium]